MRRLIPNPAELLVLAALAVLCAAIVTSIQAMQHDAGLSLFTVPLFIIAGGMGVRRYFRQAFPAAAVQPVEVTDQPELPPVESDSE